jgi:RNase adaptor protein for sRNA GlmZ degradation
MAALATYIPDVYIQSFGYGHAAPDYGLDMTFDLRDWFRDPHVSPQLRALTGLDRSVIDAVMDTEGVSEFVWTLSSLVIGQATLGVRTVRVAFGCVGGRHRSVVIAERLGHRLASCGLTVEVSHRDVNKPVLAGTRVTK